MEIYSPTLFIEINNSDYIFTVGDGNEQENFKIIYNCVVPIQGIENNQLTNLDLAFNIIKKNIYIIEQKLNFTFKETVLIINNFNCSFINLTGFKKLNGSQILKENITYILNSLKSNIDIIENQKTILHIFNSKYCLDKKKIENLPIGLFGDFYSHELSFCLIKSNDYKNLNKVFNKCNLKIKKILLKSFVEGSHISKTNPNHDTFFLIKINQNNSQIFYFENDSLKFEQNFDFGSDLVIRDITKITSLKKDVVEKIINNTKLNENILEDELIEEDLLEGINYRKIKKKLIYEIAAARIQELSELIILKNINLINCNKKVKVIFLKINNKFHYECFKDAYSQLFSNNNNFIINFLEDITIEELLNNANRLIHFGWKKEVIPISQSKKSLITRFFERLFS